MEISLIKVHFLFILFLIGSGINKGHAQYSLNDFSLADTSTQWFDEQIGTFNNELVTGEYAELTPIVKDNNPYFMARTWNTATVFYRGEEYRNINFLYNLEEEEVYIHFKRPFSYLSLPIRLYNENLDWFETQGHLFINYHIDLPNRPAGIYNQIYKSPRIAFLEKKQKISGIEDRRIVFKKFSWFRLCIDGDCHVIRNKMKFKKLFPTHKKQLRTFWRKARFGTLKKASLEELQELGKLCNTFITQE